MRYGLGSEHPLCDRIQLLILILFFLVWGIDSLCFFIFGFSTVFFQALDFPPLLTGTILSLCLSFYLVSMSHKAVLEQVHDPPTLVDSGVYAWIRHPMYLGTLLFFLSNIIPHVSTPIRSKRYAYESGSIVIATSFLRMNQGVKGPLYRIENT
jgi:protein-S-isoprenylcysteine O-methyltransferase Ste14